MRKRILVVLLIFFFLNRISAQQDLKGWQDLDPRKDSVYGISLSEAYRFLEGKKYTPIIVAVIDSGIDTTQEDLRNILWHNPGEIPGNGIDDDHNGYVDDYYGWNFLGNRDGTDLEAVPGERTRVYYHFRDKFEGKKISADSLNSQEKYEYETWKRAASEMKVTSEEQMELMLMEITLNSLKKQDLILRDEMQKSRYSIEELEKFIPQTDQGKKAKLAYLTCMKLFDVTPDETNTSIIRELDEEASGKKREMNAKIAEPADVRAKIIQDNYYDINDKYYGNSDVMGPEPLHGTHVSGIIAAQRDNNLGINGIANHVRIMMIRAIPDGDEYDKDVALAIKYAVDNGARIINMSFGKYFSPEKYWVDAAVEYAEEKNVLIVHAAGNESQDVDSVQNFPNKDLLSCNCEADNFINVGASGDRHVDNGKMIADFSNYGSQQVDVFAPGVKIYSTLPGKDSYGFESGTSMAAPVVTGIAALIRTYYPQLTAKQVKSIIMNSAVHLADSSKVYEPGTNRLVEMDSLCKSGGFVNALSALEMADKVVSAMEGKKTRIRYATRPVFIKKNLN